jgi:hypothetical protein
MTNKQSIAGQGYRSLLVVVFLFTLTSCDKLKNMITMRVNVPYSSEFVLDADTSIMIPPGGVVISLPTMVFTPNSDDILQAHNLTENEIVEVKLRTFVQKVKDANGADENSVDSLELFISTKQKPELMIAHQFNISDNIDSVVFDCVADNLKDYFLQDTIYMRLQGHFNRAPKDIRYQSDMAFTIVSKPLAED